MIEEDEGRIAVEINNKIAMVTIDRPKAHNALTPEMRAQLIGAFAELDKNPKVGAIVLTGSGDKAFCSGADLGKTIPAATSDAARAPARFFPDQTKRYLSDVFTPVIAAVKGYCVGGGLELLQGTDIRIAGENAEFGLPEVRWGVIAAGGSHVRLLQQIPWAVGMEMLLTGARIDAQRALQIGLVNRVVPVVDVVDTARAVAEQICNNAPIAVRTSKEIALRAMEFERLFVLESTMAEKVWRSEDAVEGPLAFKARRAPNFSGR